MELIYVIKFADDTFRINVPRRYTTVSISCPANDGSLVYICTLLICTKLEGIRHTCPEIPVQEPDQVECVYTPLLTNDVAKAD
jgi:hypothetical protein